MAESIFDKLNNLLGNVNIDEINSEQSGFQSLPDGYYLGEVKKAELKETKESHLPMISMQFQIVEDGMKVTMSNSNINKEIIPHTKNRYVFINWVLKDENSVKRMISDMLKFEGEEEGVSLLEKDCFTNAELIEESISALIGSRIYLMISTTEKDGKESTWTNLISWKRVKSLELE